MRKTYLLSEELVHAFDVQEKLKMIIDVNNIKTVEELHEILKKQLEFPDFYGMNWAAFWDTITGLVELPEELIFKGWVKLENEIPESCKKMRDLLSKFNKEFPNLVCNISYQ